MSTMYSQLQAQTEHVIVNVGCCNDCLEACNNDNKCRYMCRPRLGLLGLRSDRKGCVNQAMNDEMYRVSCL